MRVRVLGCHGGETPTHRTTCFLLDGRITIDAGAICRALPLVEQTQIDHILVSHSHMDHVKDLAILADQVIGQRKRPVYLHCGPETAETLRSSYFNNFLWPDFTQIPTPAQPVMKIVEHQAEETFRISIAADTDETAQEVGPSTTPLQNGEYEVTYIPVSHPVESMAMIVRGASGAILYTSDTGPTTRLWDIVNRTPDLRGLFVELSFPNSMQSLADVAGHYTPHTLDQELHKIDGRDGIPLYIYHLKPSFYDVTKQELMDLQLANMHIVELSDEFQF